MPEPDLIAALSKLLATPPGIAEEKTATHATLLTGKKVFAFTRSGGGGAALKLPKERIAELLQRDDITPLTMGKRTMKESGYCSIAQSRQTIKRTWPSSKRRSPS